MVYWSELYKEIADRICKEMPEIQWTDLWHEQVGFLTEELPFPTPAVFIGFDTVSTDDNGNLSQTCDTQVDMYLFYETFADTYGDSMNRDSALEFLDILTRLHALFHGKGGKTFGSMRRVEMRREESGNAGNLYRISFQCIVVDYSAEHLFSVSENPDAEISVSQGGKIPETEDGPLFLV